MPMVSPMADEDGQRHHRGDDARADEIFERVGGERHQRVDLLGDAHGAEFGGNRGADAARHHEGRQHRTQFAGDAKRHDGGDQAFRQLKRRRAQIDLQGQRAAGEEGGEADDGQREIADAQHLLEDLAQEDLRRQALQQPILDEQRDAADLFQQREGGAADMREDVQAVAVRFEARVEPCIAAAEPGEQLVGNRAGPACRFIDEDVGCRGFRPWCRAPPNAA